MTDQHVPVEGNVEHVLHAFEEFQRRIEGVHVPEFLNLEVTMAQAKILRILETDGELHMAELVRRLGISLSTLSGHVDGLVEHGLATRRDDPADRRQVLIAPTQAAHDLVEQFRELNTAHLSRLLQTMTSDQRLDIVHAFNHITRAIETSSAAAEPDRKELSR